MIPLKKEGLAVATGNQIWAYAYSGSALKIAERSGEVLSLTVHKDRLLDCGNYDGIRDTLTGDTVEGSGAKWRRIASWKHEGGLGKNRYFKENLFGAMETNISRHYGIWDLDNMALPFPYYQRDGKTNVLVAGHLPFDGGDYFWDAEKTEKDNMVATCHDREAVMVAIGSEDSPVTSMIPGLPLDYVYLYTEPLELHASAPGRDGLYVQRVVYSRQIGIRRAQEELIKLALKDDQLSFKKLCDYFDILKKDLPKECFTFVRSGETVEINPEAFKAGIERKGVLIGFFGLAAEKYFREKEGFTSMASPEDDLVIGRRDGAIIHPMKTPTEVDGSVIYQFRQPINALSHIPEELMNDGLRQRMIRNIQMKAVHAKARKAVAKRAA